MLFVVLLWAGEIARAADPAPEALLPEGPEVREAVARAIRAFPTLIEPRVGGQALMALACLKAGESPENPTVHKAAEALVKTVAGPELQTHDIYTLGLSIIFLVNLDAAKYGPQIESLLGELIKRQKPHGGWGYPVRPTGDTSMTQYGVLSLWEAARAGLNTPVDAWERVCNWLLRTQDPSGAFGYQGTDPGSFELVPQTEVRHSLAAAGLGSLYICQDQLGLDVPKGAARETSSILKRVEAQRQGKKGPRLTDKVDVKRVAQAQAMGNHWFEENYKVDPGQYLHYYLYAYERYQSFREASGGPREEHPWYDEMARMLLRTQSKEGTWNSLCGTACDTAFGVLFLVRSTKQSLALAGRLGSGALIAGRGLPKDADLLKLRDGNVVAEALSGPAEKLLGLMEDANNPEYLRAVEGFQQVALEADEETLNQQAVRLRRLAGSTRPEARAAAVKALGRTRDLDNVPTLIYALTDPDRDVVTAALDALRYISRKPLGATGTIVKDEAGRLAAIEQWKAWYQSVRPDARFEE